MAVLPAAASAENQQKVSLPRRMATYITSMSFAKVFRRNHHRDPPPPPPPPPPPSRSTRSPDQPTMIPHHRYPRPFSYHIPTAQQVPPSPSGKISNIVPYRIGLSSDSTLLANSQPDDSNQIVRLPSPTNKSIQSPKVRKNRRYQSQLNANKRWLFRSMETLDGWKGKMFQAKNRTSSQSRSRSVDNLADDDPDEIVSTKKQSDGMSPTTTTTTSPNRSIETLANRVIQSFGLHRKHPNSTHTAVRTPVLTVKKQSVLTHLTNGNSSKTLKQHNNNNTDVKSSAILDFRELSSLEFLNSNRRMSDESENISLVPSNGVDSSDEHDDEVTSSNLTFLVNGCDHTGDGDDETADSWDFSISWLDSLKGQDSPQQKIQLYENLIKLLEQDTLNIDELLVLRKVLAKIWPSDENSLATYGNRTYSTDPKSSKSLRIPNKPKRRPKVSTMTHHMAQRCSAILEQSPTIYETLHEQNSGIQKSSSLCTANAKPFFIRTQTEPIQQQQQQQIPIEQHYPEHLNPFDNDTDEREKENRNQNDIDISPTMRLSSENNSSDSIRRYFERLTLLETIYEKLNIESTRPCHDSEEKQCVIENGELLPPAATSQKYRCVEKRIETREEITNYTYPHPSTKYETKPTPAIPNKILEMNVDGNMSSSSGKSSLKRRAPTAPHLSQKNENNRHHPPMFTLSSNDLKSTHKIEGTDIPVGFMPDTNSPKEQIPPLATIVHETVASCDDDGHVFVYDPMPPCQITPTVHDEPSSTSPKKTERIQQWLSNCDTKEEKIDSELISSPHTLSPKTQLKLRYITKPIRSDHSNDKHRPPLPNEIEPGRFRSCLKIRLESNDNSNHRTRPSSVVSRHHRTQQLSTTDEDLDMTQNYSPEEITFNQFTHDRPQAVFL